MCLSDLPVTLWHSDVCLEAGSVNWLSLYHWGKGNPRMSRLDIALKISQSHDSPKTSPWVCHKEMFNDVCVCVDTFPDKDYPLFWDHVLLSFLVTTYLFFYKVVVTVDGLGVLFLIFLPSKWKLITKLTTLCLVPQFFGNFRKPWSLETTDLNQPSLFDSCGTKGP